VTDGEGLTGSADPKVFQGPPASTEAEAMGIPVARPGRTSVSASHLRDALALTPHQLGDLTRRLNLDVGDRHNYPRYGREGVRLLVAVQALRELLIPLEDACATALTYSDLLHTGRGWIVLYPTVQQWAAVAAATSEALASLLALTARAAVLDVEAFRHRADTAWLRLLSAPLTN
jgi:hypothetical protein